MVRTNKSIEPSSYKADHFYLQFTMDVYYTYYIGRTLLNCMVFAHSGVSGAGAWLNAHYDPVASLYTFSSCMGENNTHIHTPCALVSNTVMC